MTEYKKRFDRLSYARIDDKTMLVDFEGYVSTRFISSYKEGDILSFGVPLESIQRTLVAMYPDVFTLDGLPETNWVNVSVFNNKGSELAKELAEDIAGKDRVRIRITGTASINEYKGKKSLQVTAKDYHVLWNNASKETDIGDPSYVSGEGVEPGVAQLAIQGYVINPDMTELSDGRNVLNFGLAVNQATDKLNDILDSRLEGDTVWLNVAVYDSEKYPFAQNSAKVLRHGAAIAGLGYAKIQEYKGTESVQLSLDSFNVLQYAKKEEKPVDVSVSDEDLLNDSPFEPDTDIDVNNNPFT